MERQKTKKKDFQSGFPECMGCSARGRELLPQVPRLQRSGKRFLPRVPGLRRSWKRFLPRVHSTVALGEEKFKKIRRKRRRPATNGVNSSPSVETALEKAFSSVRFLALGEDVFPVKTYPGDFLPRVPGLRRSGKRVSSPSVAPGEENFKKIRRKRRQPVTNGVNSSPSVETAIGKAFSKCTIFGSRRRRLSHKEIPRRLFPECCTRGRLPRVQLSLRRVHLALGEATPSRSVTRLCHVKSHIQPHYSVCKHL